MPFLVSLPVLLLHPLSPPCSLHRSCTLPARPVTVRRLNAARYSLDVTHQYGAFSPLHASLISVGRFQIHDMHIFDVIKCNYLYRQPPRSALWHPFKHASNVGERATPSVVIRPPSTVHRLSRIYQRNRQLVPTALSALCEHPGSRRRRGSTRPAWRRPMRRGT